MRLRTINTELNQTQRTKGQVMLVCAITVDENPRLILIQGSIDPRIVSEDAELFLVPLVVLCDIDAAAFFAGDRKSITHAEQLAGVLYKDVPVERLAYVCQQYTCLALFSLFDQRKEILERKARDSSANYTLGQFIKELAVALELQARSA